MMKGSSVWGGGCTSQRLCVQTVRVFTGLLDNGDKAHCGAVVLCFNGPAACHRGKFFFFSLFLKGRYVLLQGHCQHLLAFSLQSGTMEVSHEGQLTVNHLLGRFSQPVEAGEN